MTDAWFSPETARLFSYLSLLSLCSLFAIPAQKGRLRGLATAVWNAVMGFSVLLLALGGLATALGQPAHVGRSLLLTGLIVGATFAGTRRALTRSYTEAELRRTVAADL
jgi:hypothetical protein